MKVIYIATVLALMTAGCASNKTRQNVAAVPIVYTVAAPAPGVPSPAPVVEGNYAISTNPTVWASQPQAGWYVPPPQDSVARFDSYQSQSAPVAVERKPGFVLPIPLVVYSYGGSYGGYHHRPSYKRYHYRESGTYLHVGSRGVHSHSYSVRY